MAGKLIRPGYISSDTFGIIGKSCKFKFCPNYFFKLLADSRDISGQ